MIGKAWYFDKDQNPIKDNKQLWIIRCDCCERGLISNEPKLPAEWIEAVEAKAYCHYNLVRHYCQVCALLK